MKYEVVTIGDAMKDIFIFPSVEEMEKPVLGEKINFKNKDEKFLVFGYGDKITVSDSYQDIGGTACNVAVGLAKLGIKTSIITNLGKDSEGEEVEKKLTESHVGLEFIKKVANKKTSFSIIISYKGERSILVFHSFKPDDFEFPKKLDTEWIYIGALGENYRHIYSKVTALAAEKNIKIALNPGSVQIHDGLAAFGGLLNVADVLFLNREEAKALAGLPGVANIREIFYALKKTGVKIIVVTDGDEGAYVSTEDKFLKIGSYPAQRLESTGAGDAFASGFLAGLIQNQELFDCLKQGVINSASVIENYGAQKGLLSLGVLRRRMKEHRFPASTLRFS